MFKIKHVKITGFWGRYSIETDLFKDVNIFIGKNGTGKTTLINLLQGVLTVDMELLYNLQFDEITLILNQKHKTRKIVVSKITSEYAIEYKSLKYQIGTKVYDVPFIHAPDLKYISRQTGRYPSQFYRNIDLIRESFRQLVNVSYLSVNRDSLLSQDDSRDSISEKANAIDSRMDELMNGLTTYQLQLETELSKLSKGFQENVLRSMLFNEAFDKVNINESHRFDLKRISVGLKQAYRGLGILDTITSEVIDKHVLAISKASEAIDKYMADATSPIYPNDVTPLTLLRRTKKIIELSTELEENKRKIFKPITDYIKLLNEFHETKEFSLQDTKVGGLKITNNQNQISSIQLSSGEKQLIILLTECLLQKNDETLFIADEPELSLHIEWQRKVVSSIIRLNPNAQVIIATHSPEIVGKFRDNTKNMEAIIHG
jgi:predicted ATP-dependent endonuclease of OLD family